MVHVCHVMLTLALLCINLMSAGDAGEEKDGPPAALHRRPQRPEADPGVRLSHVPHPAQSHGRWPGRRESRPGTV